MSSYLKKESKWRSFINNKKYTELTSQDNNGPACLYIYWPLIKV